MANGYQVVAETRRIEKDFHNTLDRLTEEQRTSLRSTLQNDPKGNAATHWKIKKVKQDIWQCDLPSGYRLAYTVEDTPVKVVLILFAGNHDDAAVFLRRKS
jgi:mRNA-degrading endonuclease RelE of RelBE toxin-antitoxin system